METTQTVQNNNKMMACKTCGAQMAKSAKKCPYFGAKNPKKRIKKLIVLLIIVGIIVGYPSFFIIRDNISATITCRNGEELHYNELRNIYGDYLNNDDYKEFVNEYLPAEVVVKGKITEIDNITVGATSDGLNVHLESGACKVAKIEINNEYVYLIKYDLYKDAEDYDFGKLKVGDKVTATGVITNSITLTENNQRYAVLPSELEVIGTADGIVKD